MHINQVMNMSWEKGVAEYVENEKIQDGRICRHLRGVNEQRSRCVRALTLNATCPLFLRQCFVLAPSSMPILASGTSRKLPICMQVSHYVSWRMT